MSTRLLLCCIFFTLASCRPSPFRVETLSVKNAPPIESADPALARNFEARLDDALAERYRKKNKPSFAIINGYYRLPEAKPYGAATVVRSYSYQTYFEGMTITKETRGDVITPITGDDAFSLERALNALLSIGVNIKEIAMTDALAIAKAEEEALKSDKTFLASSALPPGVDFLMSIYPSTSARGPVLIGRVIKRDGTLMAFRVIYRGSNQLVGSLIISLFEDTISRI